MSTRDEALTACYVAARALRQHGCTNELLAALFTAVDAVDAVGWVASVTVDRTGPPPVPPGLCRGSEECWRRADTAAGTCFEHSEWATAERVRAVIRDPIFQGESDG